MEEEGRTKETCEVIHRALDRYVAAIDAHQVEQTRRTTEFITTTTAAIQVLNTITYAMKAEFNKALKDDYDPLKTVVTKHIDGHWKWIATYGGSLAIIATAIVILSKVVK